MLAEPIDDNTFEMHVTPIDSIQVGGFDWSLIYHWHGIPKWEKLRRKTKIEPIRSVIIKKLKNISLDLINILAYNGRWFVCH
jgi:hypothetical protein